MSVRLALITAGTLQYIVSKFEAYHYSGPFIVLMLCGLGAPLPEEVPLIGSGLLVSKGNVNFWTINLVCASAILLGDSIPYWLGRHYGLSILKIRFVAKILHPERFAKLERRFEQNGNWAIFTCRFLPGLRIPGYFTAGTLRMSYARFMLLDSLGVLISVPTSILLAKLFFDKFGDDLDRVQSDVSRYNRYILIGVIALVLGFLIWRKIRKRRKEAKEAIETAPIDGP